VIGPNSALCPDWVHQPTYDRCPLRVDRFTSTLCRSLPVFPRPTDIARPPRLVRFVPTANLLDAQEWAYLASIRDVEPSALVPAK
jgi:hypothetical protein